MRLGPSSKVKKDDFKCQNELFGPNMNVKIGFRNSKFDNRPYLNVKIGFRISKCYIRSKFECKNSILHDKMRYSVRVEWQNRNSNVKMRYSSWVRMLKQDLECKNAIFGPNSKVTKMSKWDIHLQFECQNRISNGTMLYSSSQFKWQNRISNVEML